MSSLIFSILCLYFNFVTYKEFKQIAYEIFYIENNIGEGRGEDRDYSRDRSWGDRSLADRYE